MTNKELYYKAMDKGRQAEVRVNGILRGGYILAEVFYYIGPVSLGYQAHKL